ncbi:MAG TPA: c-type cytochrome [Acidobacteriota bacterium]|nr:c-type cytochrome [Acidobacteriota bacterium]
MTLLLLLLAALTLTVLVIVFRDEIFPEYSPAQRGARLMEEAGCWSCHNPASSGAFNPAKDDSAQEYSSIPSLFSQRMSIAEMRQWIADGITDEKEHSQVYMASRQQEALKMPAYKHHLSVEQIDDIIAYLALEQYRYEVDQALRQGSDYPLTPGEALAHRMACYSCHGALGQGGIGNLDSLKGYIPGFFGDDFDALTGAGERTQVLEWIRDGASQAFLDQGFLGFSPGRYFQQRQAIDMPAYADHMSEEDLQALTDHVLELRALGPLTARQFLREKPLGRTDAADPAEGEEPVRTDDLTSARNSDADYSLFYQVRPILRRCLNCHGPGEQKSEFRMDTRERMLAGGEIAEFMERKAVVPGDPDASMLVTFIEADEEDPYNEIYPMPPKGDPLTPGEIELIRRWIRENIPWPPGEELLPPEEEEN